MRITLPLTFPQKWKWLDSYSWHRWRKQGVTSTNMKEKLTKAGYQIEDINEVVKRDSPLFIDVDAIPNAEPVFPSPPKEDETHPDWHNERIRVFDDTSFPFEGVAQAQNFTKSVRLQKGLPQVVLELGKSMKIENQDERIQRIVKQAHLWDATLDPLPKLRDLDIPQFAFGRQYGIPLERRNETLLTNFLRLCESNFPDIARNRMVARGEELQAVCKRDHVPVILKYTPMLTMLGKETIKPFCESPEVTENALIPEIYPIKSAAGTSKVNIYREEDNFVFPEESPFPYAHTLYFSHHIAGSHTHSHPRWNDGRFAGSTILYNFSAALLMARRKFGDNAKGILPEPITTQAVHVTGQEFQFCIFQLNNADLDGESTVKNIVWITPKIKLFTSCDIDRSANVQYTGYNPDVFEMFLGMYGSETRA